MTAAEFQDLVEARFLAAWTDDSVTLLTPLALQNVRGLLTLVDGSSRLRQPPESAAWARLAIYEQDLGQRTIGADQNEAETIGRVTVEIYVPEGEGLKEAKALGERAILIFERFSATRMMFHCADTTRREVGRVLQGLARTDVGTAWWRYDVAIPYWRRRLIMAPAA